MRMTASSLVAETVWKDIESTRSGPSVIPLVYCSSSIILTENFPNDHSFAGLSTINQLKMEQ